MWQSEILSGIATAELTDTVTRIVAEAVQSFRVKMGSYDFAPQFSSQIGPQVVLAHFGYPDEWDYTDPDFRKHDPLPDFVMRYGLSITWNEAGGLIKMTTEQAQFAEMSQKHGLVGPDVDGFSAPLYGPNGQEAYCAFSLGRNFTQSDQEVIFRILSISQFGHSRITQLLAAEYALEADLLECELDVLNWLARRKSLTDIASITGLSRATVDTYVRRIYAKLGVIDRVTATMAGLRHGLIMF